MVQGTDKREEPNSAEGEETKAPGGTIHLRIMNPDRMLFEGDVSSLFLQGDQGEYEILPYHYPVLGLLKRGQLIVDWAKILKVNNGIVRFNDNDCVIILELDEEARKAKW